jgi:hypothetical protein
MLLAKGVIGGFPSSSRTPRRRGPCPARARTQALLTHAAVELFVTHGGLNSTLEGLSAGLPLIVMPFFADQPINAQHVVNKGLGEAVRACAWGRGPPALAWRLGRV